MDMTLDEMLGSYVWHGMFPLIFLAQIAILTTTESATPLGLFS